MVSQRLNRVRRSFFLSVAIAALLSANIACGLSLRDASYDGIWQDFGGNWWYCYYAAPDNAVWRYQSNLRFSYSYVPGQWSNYDGSGSWWTIGGSAMTTSFIGDGGWYDMKNGFLFNYSAVRDKGHWARTGFLSSAFRFAYYYNTGQWWDCDRLNTWHAISGTGATAAFVGDGGSYDMKNGFTFNYSVTADISNWARNAASRFSYDYQLEQWKDYDKFDTWHVISGTSAAGGFIGDGRWYDMKNGFTFNYSVTRDIANWARNSVFHFNYNYQLGQWKDCDMFNTWHIISGADAGGGLIADGGWYDMKNGFTFNYSVTLNKANWARNSVFRFAYDYNLGQWMDCDKFNAWHFISWAGANGGLVGDGGWYDMKNGFVFNYSVSRDIGNWVRNSAFRFVYDYNTAQWKDFDRFNSWHYISAAEANGGCIGDGNWYDLKNGFTFSYSSFLDKAYWAQNSLTLFAYEYNVGQWWDHGYNDVWNTLGSAAISSAFVGDHQFHNVGLHDGYWYQYWYDNKAYYGASDSGQFTDKFVYNYSTGQWGYIITDRWEDLGPGGQASQFAWVGMGDVGLRWQFASGIDPSVFGFNLSNTIDAFIKFDENGDGSLDRILYFDDYGHKVAEGEITTGSMGIRIAVAKSYVGAGDSWSDYWSYWSENIPYSPLVYIFDNQGNQLFKQYYVQYISAIGAGAVMRDGEAWIWEDANGNGLYDSNLTDSGDRILHWRQQKGGTCGIFSPINIVESVKGNGPNQVQFSSSYPDDTIQWFSDTCYSPDQMLYHRFNPPYDRNTMDLHDDIYGQWGGVYPEEQTQYLTTQQGFQNPQWVRGSTSTWDNFVAQVESGKLALTEVDAYSIWAFVFPATDSKGQLRDADHDGYLDAGYDVTGLEVPSGVHWVWVRGFQRDAAGNITYVLIEDSALFSGSVGRVPVDHFEHAWERNDLRRAGFFDPPSGFTWSTAGASTWKFSPQVWSATW